MKIWFNITVIILALGIVMFNVPAITQSTGKTATEKESTNGVDSAVETILQWRSQDYEMGNYGFYCQQTIPRNDCIAFLGQVKLDPELRQALADVKDLGIKLYLDNHFAIGRYSISVNPRARPNQIMEYLFGSKKHE